MHPVQKYIESMFLNLPNDPEIQRLKEDLSRKSMKRYETLISEGATPQEALAELIVELEAEEQDLLNIYHKKEEQVREQNYQELMTLSEAHEFLDHNRKESSRIGRAILYILIAVGLVPTLDVFNLGEIGILAMFIVIALSVGMLIMAGMGLEDYFDKGEYAPISFTHEDYQKLQSEFRTFKREERYRIPLGVALCIISVVPLLFFTFSDNEFLEEALEVILLLALVGLGVYQFIQYGMTHGAYERLLHLGEYTRENLEYERRLEPVAGIYWMLIVLIYLLWSFLTMDWHITWIIWPLAGIIWGIIALIVKAVSRE